MSEVIKFRIVLDHEDDVFRDLELLSDQNFEQLHKAIMDNFGFDGSEMASFYISNDNWDKGQEITLLDMSDGSGGTLVMSDTPLEQVIEKEGQKLVYVFDFLLMWCFFVEVLEISEPAKGTKYPCCNNKFGKAPDQYSKSPADVPPMEDTAFNEQIDESPETDLYGDYNDLENFNLN